MDDLGGKTPYFWKHPHWYSLCKVIRPKMANPIAEATHVWQIRMLRQAGECATAQGWCFSGVVEKKKDLKKTFNPLPKFNVEPENKPLEEEIPFTFSFWKPSFSVSMFIFWGVDFKYYSTNVMLGFQKIPTNSCFSTPNNCFECPYVWCPHFSVPSKTFNKKEEMLVSFWRVYHILYDLGCPPSQWQMKVYRDPLLKHIIILVVTVTGQGDNPMYDHMIFSVGCVCKSTAFFFVGVLHHPFLAGGEVCSDGQRCHGRDGRHGT